jgi:dCMP deaminase
MNFTEKWHFRFLNLAREVATWSKDPSTQVGAVIVSPDKRIVSVGFNGFPRGMIDDPKILEDREEKYSRIIHAEVNALIQAKEPLNGTALYTWPFPPCERCVVQMLQAGIRDFIAPTPTEEIMIRWGTALDKTYRYIKEMGGTLRLY